MEFKFEGGVLQFDKVITDLDKLVFDFVSILDKFGLRYVIISGYVAIAVGRSRGTEDVDIFIEKTGFDKFRVLVKELVDNDYWILNTDDVEDAFEFLEDGLAIRFAEKGKAVPNFEVKFPKKETDFLSLNEPLTVIINGHRLLMSPFEIQIPFKLWLGSDKDIEDAVHVYELFKNKLNKSFMNRMANTLGVKKEMNKYGIK